MGEKRTVRARPAELLEMEEHMKPPVKAIHFSFRDAGHLQTAMPLVTTAQDCCEGLFGEGSLGSPLPWDVYVLPLSHMPVAIVLATGSIEAQALGKVLRHVFGKHLKDGTWRTGPAELNEDGTCTLGPDEP
jgi:hypothetical protein